jgi:ribosomal protein L29
MKKKEFEQLKTKNVTELTKVLDERRARLWSLRVELGSGKVKNVREIRRVKRDIARLLTILNNQ